ncbi:MAG: Uncharacterized protein RBG13Loki_2142 [Promethearchaeota archaeon CR_4]|nr:MAG: Uncharacterized protein RBG13Loki_2142 [Candidatus Lokiarchaeota archaeon CR_4]
MKPWVTKEWKQKRQIALKDLCEQCSTKEGILVLHHLEQPPSSNDIRYKVTCTMLDEALKAGKVTYQTTKRDACPNCQLLSITYRKTMNPPWRCVRCEYTFFTPIQIDYVSPQSRKDTFKAFREQNLEQINARAEQIIGEYNEKYMTMEGTVTFCKKCAFLWDKKHLKLCPECRIHYTKIGRQRCFDCHELATGSNVAITKEQTEEIKDLSSFEESRKEDHECLAKFLAGRALENLSKYDAGCLIRELSKIPVPQKQLCGLIALMEKELLIEESIMGEIDDGECWYCGEAGFPTENRARCEQEFKKSLIDTAYED